MDTKEDVRTLKGKKMKSSSLYYIIGAICLIAYLYGAFTGADESSVNRLLIITAWFGILAEIKDMRGE